MSKKFQVLLGLLIVFSMILGACAPAVAPVVQEPQAPVVEEPQAPVVEEPEPGMAQMFADFITNLPAEQKFYSVTAADLNQMLAENAPFIVDVRQASELEANGYIEGSIHVEIRELMKNLDKLPGKDEKIVVVCASGHRGGYAMVALRMLGYTSVFNLNGGMNAWKKAEFAVVEGMPEAAASISTPDVDAELLAYFDEYLSNLDPAAGFGSVKNDGLNAELVEGKDLFLLDVRRQAEWDANGSIEGAVLVPLNDVPASLDKLPTDKDAPIVVICASGHRGGAAQMYLQELGYTNVRNLNGGMNAWIGAGLPVVGLVSDMGAFLANLPSDAGFYSIKADKLNELLAETSPFIVDVREPAELEANGFIAGSINIPIRDLLKNLDKLPAKDAKIVITCASGHRGSLGMMALRLLGYTDVVNLNGGLNAWLKAEFPVEKGAPNAPLAGTAPEVDAARLASLDAYLSNLPEGFGATKSPDFNIELVAGDVPFMVDVRTQAEWDANGHIEGAIHIPVNDVPANLAQFPADKSAPIMVICASGHRGALAQMYLHFLGYTNVRNLNGGMNGWAAAELPIVKQ
jgi:rhodanese-related sulfurtransferase